MPESRVINGVNVYGFTSKKELIDYIFDRKGILIAINAEKIYNATDQTRQIINNNVGYTDGIGAIMALKKCGVKNAVKISGCELWLDIIKFFYRYHTFYLIGGTTETIDATISKLTQEFEGIKILGFRNGYIKNEEERETLLYDIVRTQPDFVFVAMGSPKQEVLMEELHKKHKAVYQGLGGSLDVYIGKVNRAPNWWIDHKLEWAYRLIKQPSRIKRQWTLVPFYFSLIIKKFNKK